MDHIPPISPFGQPIYGTPLSPGHAVNLQHTLSALAQTLDDNSYKGADGKVDSDQLGGMVDVLLFFDSKLSHPEFHKDVTELCKQFEEYKKNPTPDLIKPMQETLKTLGAKHPEIPHNQYIDLISGVLSHIKEEIHAS